MPQVHSGVGGRKLGEEKDALLLLCPLPRFLGACNSIFQPYLCILRARGHTTCPTRRSRNRWRNYLALIFKFVYKIAKSSLRLSVCPFASLSVLTGQLGSHWISFLVFKLGISFTICQNLKFG